MNSRYAILILAAASFARANEALDILEADKKPTEIPASIIPVFPGNLSYPEITKPEWQTRTFDPILSRAVVFEDESNPWVQRVAITGFFDWGASFGAADVDAANGTPAKSIDLDSTRARRARLGARIRAFSNTDIEANGEFAGSGDYNGIERLSARTQYRPDAGVTYGKFRPQFSAEYRQEPEFSPYPDRAMLVNMIAPHTTLGVHFDHRRNDWEYGIGWFSGDWDPYVPSVSGDGLLALNLAKTIVEMNGDVMTRTRWHLDYLHNFDAGRSNTLPRYNVAGKTSANGNQLVANNPAFRHLFSTGFVLDQDRMSFLGDFMLAKGETTAWGLTLGPSWWAVPGVVEIVGRYHYAASDDPGALVSTMGLAADPFFDSSPFFIGDEYHSFYFGANTHFYKDRMLLMTGVENVMLKDDAGGGFNSDAWIWHTGVKASF